MSAAASGVCCSSASTGRWQCWVGASAAKEEEDGRTESRFDVPRARHAGSVALPILGRRRVQRIVALLPHSNIRDGNIPLPPPRLRETIGEPAAQRRGGRLAARPRDIYSYIRVCSFQLSIYIHVLARTEGGFTFRSNFPFSGVCHRSTCHSRSLATHHWCVRGSTRIAPSRSLQG